MTTIYQSFITYLYHLEKHPILFLHDGGNKNVLCSPKNHTLAHYYRYLAYGQLGDKVKCFGIKK